MMSRENMAVLAQDMGLDLSCIEGACEVEKMGHGRLAAIGPQVEQLPGMEEEHQSTIRCQGAVQSVAKEHPWEVAPGKPEQGNAKER